MEEQEQTIVRVNAIRVASMVHTMMARSVEQIFNGSQLANRFSVNPVLEQEVEVLVGDKHGRRQDKGKRKVEHPTKVTLQHALPQRRGLIVVLRAVMHHMSRPEQVHLMTGTMEPVISKVNKDEPEHPGPQRQRVQLHQRVAFIHPNVSLQSNGSQDEQVDKLLDHPSCQRCQQVVQARTGPGNWSFLWKSGAIVGN